MSTGWQDAAPTDRNGEDIPVRASSCTPVFLSEKAPTTAQARTLPVNPSAKPYPTQASGVEPVNSGHLSSEPTGQAYPTCRLKVPGSYTYPPSYEPGGQALSHQYMAMITRPGLANFLRTPGQAPIPPQTEPTGQAPIPPQTEPTGQASIPRSPTPARTRKTPPPRPASRARPPPPPPWIRTRSVSTRQGRVRKMIPVTVCGASRPEVLAALPLIQHRCDIVNTLVGRSGGFFSRLRENVGKWGFFCHSVIQGGSSDSVRPTAGPEGPRPSPAPVLFISAP